MNTTTTATVDLDADRYLKEVAPHLSALPADERADLLDDLAQHLREIAAEPGPPLAERLGPPEAYAAELLASAGVGGAELRRPPLLARVSSLLERARRSWVGRELVRLEPVLRPAWWVIRGYLAVSLLAAFEGNGQRRAFPVPALLGNPALGLLGVLAAIPVSVRLAQRPLPRAGRLAVSGANVVLAIYALSLLGGAAAPEPRYVTPYERLDASYDGCLATATGRRITNLYAYDADGRLLDPVLLYDQDGQPVDNLCPAFDERGRRLSTEYRQDVNGSPVTNAFPRRQSAFVPPEPALPRHGAPAAPGSTVPVKPPAVVVPRLAPTTTATTTAPPG